MDYEKLQANYIELRKKKYEQMTPAEKKKHIEEFVKYLSSVARKASSPHSVTSL
jgi:hypothetical protein